MATKKQASEVEAFVLVDCQYGKCGEVVALPQPEAETGVVEGVLDLAPAAIAYAKSSKE